MDEGILTDSFDASKPAGSPDAKVGGSDEELMEACKSFEAYFLEQMFKEMQKYGIEPLVTICHYEIPWAIVTKYGGFSNREVIDLFVKIDAE